MNCKAAYYSAANWKRLVYAYGDNGATEDDIFEKKIV